MVNDMNSQDDQALADEWAAALEEAGDIGQNDIDALLAAAGHGAREAREIGGTQLRLVRGRARVEEQAQLLGRRSAGR